MLGVVFITTNAVIIIKALNTLGDMTGLLYITRLWCAVYGVVSSVGRALDF